VMLHHAAMDAHDLRLLAALIAATARHPHARWVSMGEVLGFTSHQFKIKEEVL
jgi:hypothetical protein